MIDKLFNSVTNLSGVTNSGTVIADGADAAAAAGSNAAGANKENVDIIIKEVKAIVETATSSGMNVSAGNPGVAVEKNDNNAVEALAKSARAAEANAGPLLASEVAKADPWAMIDKIKSAAKTSSGGNTNATAANNDAGILATKLPGSDTHNGAKTNADLAAAVALKAMTKGGKFSANSSGEEEGAVKAAAANAVNKVLGVLDEIIRRTVNHQLVKIKDAVKGIQYSENTAEKSEGATK